MGLWEGRIWCHFAQQDSSPNITTRNENYWTYWRKFFFWFAQNYSLWLYPKYFMSSENLTKYYLTISLKWKGWTFLGNLVQIFSAKNRSWCDVSNKTISYVILYVWKALSEVRFYILDSSQVLFGEPSFGLSLITDNFYSVAIIVWMLTLMTWRVSVMQKYSQCAALMLIVANKEAGMDRPDREIVKVEVSNLSFIWQMVISGLAMVTSWWLKFVHQKIRTRNKTIDY